jgi:single-strand DNA-binding protein
MSKGSINKVILVGRLGRDPETKELPNGLLCNWSMATTDYNSKTKEAKTEWHRCVAFGKVAEIIDKWVRKGDLIFVEGSIRTSKYTDKNEIERTSTNIMVHAVKMLGNKREETAPQTEVNFDDLEDVPF